MNSPMSSPPWNIAHIEIKKKEKGEKHKFILIQSEMRFRIYLIFDSTICNVRFYKVHNTIYFQI